MGFNKYVIKFDIFNRPFSVKQLRLVWSGSTDFRRGKIDE